jgi:SH3-like domain-containing protein
MSKWYALLLVGLLPCGAVAAQPDETGPNAGEVFPRSGSLKRGEVNVRSGPGTQYPIVWVYRRAGYPVALVARFDNYLKIRDFEGEEGWVHQAMIGRRLTALVASKEPLRLLRKPDQASRAVARLAPGVVVALKEPCAANWCEVEVVPSGEAGYVPAAELEVPTPEALQGPTP